MKDSSTWRTPALGPHADRAAPRASDQRRPEPRRSTRRSCAAARARGGVARAAPPPEEEARCVRAVGDTPPPSARAPMTGAAAPCHGRRAPPAGAGRGERHPSRSRARWSARAAPRRARPRQPGQVRQGRTQARPARRAPDVRRGGGAAARAAARRAALRAAWRAARDRGSAAWSDSTGGRSSPASTSLAPSGRPPPPRFAGCWPNSRARPRTSSSRPSRRPRARSEGRDWRALALALDRLIREHERSVRDESLPAERWAWADERLHEARAQIMESAT